MAIYKVNNEKFEKLESSTFEREKVYEVNHLQKYITNSIEVLGDDLLVISTEFSNWADSNRRIDVLCVDKEGNLVVIELKRTQEGAHMELQALRYASMVANMTYETTLNCFSSYLRKIGSTEEAGIILSNFLGGINEDDFGKRVRIILVSADFGVELTNSVLWLNEQDLDITCFKISIQKDKEELYYDIQQIIPLPEAIDYQVKQKEKIEEERQIRKEGLREQSIVLKLFDLGKIKIGDSFILKPAIEQGVPEDEVTVNLSRRGNNCLSYKGRDVSFSSLRGTWVKEYNLKDVNPSWGFTMKQDWIHKESGKTLEELNILN
ncbi:endonuclease NucS domain-containing protein [Myroides odoratimimus]|uniref:Endonuclease NucS C-terminal domain-containing protein n=1 Tax=Myroides odoratimimus CIP 101113 TaxID=883154 RepID=A0AAV3F3F4_9FLAO|nr:endonuclease NucS domain-containing protein [Myroides odoratimimus]EHO12580.1 hypothetical protein HMPREF9715_01735 [Myroides odoratimimus CIP 101113]